LPSRRGPDEENDDEDDDDNDGVPIWHGRGLSNASMEDETLIQALKSANIELNKKLKEAEDTLERRIAEYDEELGELTNRIEDLKSELNSAKRDDKELRAKDVSVCVSFADVRLTHNFLIALQSEPDCFIGS
jgi:predicted RNase H-like nuclease (RuvC/YqgF family)